MQRAQAVCEPRVLGPLVGVKPQTELLDAAQPLKFRGVDQANQQPVLGVVIAQRNDIVNRIAIDSMRQTLGPDTSNELGRSLPQQPPKRSGEGPLPGLSLRTSLRLFTEFRNKNQIF